MVLAARAVPRFISGAETRRCRCALLGCEARRLSETDLTPSMPSRVRVRYRVVTRTTTRRRRKNDPTILLAAIAVLSVMGAIIAVQCAPTMPLDRRGMRRIRLLGGAERDGVVGGLDVSNEPARIVDRWIHQSRRFRAYRFAVRTNDGLLDSIELKTSGDQALWNAAQSGGAVGRSSDSRRPRPMRRGM